MGLVHVVFGFLIKVNEFSIFDLFDLSPIFDFEVGYSCGDKSSLTFHKWGGRKEYKSYYDENFNEVNVVTIHDETDIKIINGNYFCYKRIPYLDLLNNGQIIKKGSKCPSEYLKNCGLLDTLEQELCIGENDKCPLYEIGLGDNPLDDKYIYNERAKVYYNKENYNKEN